MAMGSTGTINIAAEMMTRAIAAVSTYKEATDAYHTQLTEAMETLFSTNFSGAAAEGLDYFFDNNIEPLIGTNLTELLANLTKMAEGILSNMPGVGGLDDQLGDGNRQ